MWTLGLFGLIAIVIAAVGLYGILAHAVAQRAHELGIRMALGADRRDLRALVMREGVVTAMAGVVFGVAGSLMAMRLLESLLLPETTADLSSFPAMISRFVVVRRTRDISTPWASRSWRAVTSATRIAATRRPSPS